MLTWLLFRAHYATETRLADDSIDLLLCFLCPENGTLISGIPTTILIGWGLSWCSLSLLYGLLKSSLNGVSLDSATCSIFSGSSSSPVFQGNALFKRASIHIVAILLGALCHRKQGSANVVFLWFTFLKEVNCYFFWQNDRPLHEDSRQDNLQRHHSLQCGIPYRFYWILWSYVYGVESHRQTRSVHVRCFSIVITIWSPLIPLVEL